MLAASRSTMRQLKLRSCSAVPDGERHPDFLRRKAPRIGVDFAVHGDAGARAAPRFLVALKGAGVDVVGGERFAIGLRAGAQVALDQPMRRAERRRTGARH